MICKNCGKENSDNVSYCESCGYLINNIKKWTKKDKIISIISGLLGLPGIIYCVWYVLYIVNDVLCESTVHYDSFVRFNVLPILLINIFLLIFFMIRYRNVVATISFTFGIITLFILPIVYVVVYSHAVAFYCLGELCTCGGLDGATSNKMSLEFLRPFELILNIK